MGVVSAPDSAASPSAAETPRSIACLNCGAPMHGPFCAQCGQRDVPPYPSVRELAIDAFWELSGWDGRFMSTVRALFNHPGLLTRDFLEGRRARYISPVRLYLMSSLVYFLLAAAAPRVNLGAKPSKDFVGVQGSGFQIGTSAGRSTAASRVGEAAKSSMDAARENKDLDIQFDSLTAVRRDSILKDIARAPAIFRPLLRRAVVDSKGLQRSITEAMPRMLFALLPVFAAILALFYRGRKYPEHLYFAIHLHAFVFLALAIKTLSEFTRNQAFANLVGLSIVLLWIPAYAAIALRRTYGGSRAATIAKEAGIGAIYVVALSAAFLATVWVVAVFG